MIKTHYKNIFLMLTLNFLFMIIIFSMLSSTDLKNTSLLALIGILQYIWMFFSWYSLTKNLMNIYLFFITLCFFFYSGQPLLVLLNIDLPIMSLQSSPFSISEINKTFIFLLEAMLLFHTGALLSVKNYRVKYYPVNMKIVASVGMFFFAISFIPQIVSTIDALKTSLTIGYSNIYQSDFAMGAGIAGGIPRFLAGFFKASLLLLILGNKNNPRRLKFWVLFSLSLTTVSILAGQRGTNSLFILGIIMLYHYAIKPFTKKQAYGFIVLIPLGGYILSSISVLRNVGVAGYGISDIAEMVAKGNPLLNIIGEMGFTLITCTTVAVFSPSLVPFNGGESYFNNLFSLIPNLFWTVNPSAVGSVDQVFGHFLNANSGMGSSFIAEAYYNFGMYGLLIMPLFGYLVGKLYFETLAASKNKNYLKLYACIYMSFVILWYVRSDTTGFWRNLAYYSILPIIIVKSLSSISKKLQRKRVRY